MFVSVKTKRFSKIFSRESIPRLSQQFVELLFVNTWLIGENPPSPQSGASLRRLVFLATGTPRQ
jgi:hypothetical protein